MHGSLWIKIMCVSSELVLSDPGWRRSTQGFQKLFYISNLYIGNSINWNVQNQKFNQFLINQFQIKSV